MVIELLATLILATHLVAMNLASAGPLCFLWIPWGSHGDGNGRGRDLLPRMIRWSVVAYLVGMVTGGLLWVVLPGDGLSQALARFPMRAYGFAAAELTFSLACLLPLALTWNRLQDRPWLGKLLAILSATNLLYHFPPLMAVIGQLTVNPHWSTEPILTRSAVLGLMSKGHVLALSFHFGLSSIVVAGCATLLLASQVSEPTALFQRIIRRAGIAALLSTLLQIPVGIWLLASTSSAARNSLMGGSLAGSLAFVAALTGMILLLQRLISIVLGDCNRRTLLETFWLLIVVIILMTGTLRWSRIPKIRADLQHDNVSAQAEAIDFIGFEG